MLSYWPVVMNTPPPPPEANQRLGGARARTGELQVARPATSSARRRRDTFGAVTRSAPELAPSRRPRQVGRARWPATRTTRLLGSALLLCLVWAAMPTQQLSATATATGRLHSVLTRTSLGIRTVRVGYAHQWHRAACYQGPTHGTYRRTHTSLGRTVAPQAALPSLCAQVDRARAGRRARVERAPLDRRLARQPPCEAAAARAACRGVAPRRLAAWSKRLLWQRHGSAPAAPQGAPVGSDSHGTPVADGRP